jgi:hypothetical protein
MRTTPASETAGAQRGSGSDSKGTGASGGVAFLVGELRFTPGMVTQMVPGRGTDDDLAKDRPFQAADRRGSMEKYRR